MYCMPTRKRVSLLMRLMPRESGSCFLLFFFPSPFPPLGAFLYPLPPPTRGHTPPLVRSSFSHVLFCFFLCDARFCTRSGWVGGSALNPGGTRGKWHKTEGERPTDRRKTTPEGEAETKVVGLPVGVGEWRPPLSSTPPRNRWRGRSPARWRDS